MNDSLLDLSFPAVAGCEVVAHFDGGEITSDAGLLLLREADRTVGLCAALASAITDRRQAGKVMHSLETLVRERVYAIAQGYADANDLGHLREDPALKIACGLPPGATGVLASQPTLSRLENAVSRKDLVRMGRALAECVIRQLPSTTRSVTIDVDPTDDPCHGQQEGEQFNAHYDCHCYLPLQVYVTGADGVQRLVGAVLRPGCASYKGGLFGVLKRLVKRLRARLPGVRLILRADSGFGNAEVLAFCERHDVRYVLGLSANARLHALSTPVQMDTAIKYSLQGDRTPEYGALAYQAGSWPQERRVVVKVEVTEDAQHPQRNKLNPRFVVSDLSGPARGVYRFYCARGDRENRIKEGKDDLESGRTSCHRFLANQCRLLWHAAAQVLLQTLQQAARGTRWAKAQAATLRLRLLKVGARVVQSGRRIGLHLPSRYGLQEVWRRLYRRLCLSP